jgi:hypothetical protein
MENDERFNETESPSDNQPSYENCEKLSSEDPSQKEDNKFQEEALSPSAKQNEGAVRVPDYDYRTPGRFLDGYADVIEGMGSKAEEIQQVVFKNLIKRNMKDVNVGLFNCFVSITSDELRRNTIALSKPGFSTMVYITASGDDLFVSWKSFYKPVLNINTMLIIGFLAGILSLIITLRLDFLGFWGWLIITILLFLQGLNLGEQVGQIFKGDRYALFITEPNWFDVDNVKAMNLTIHKTLIRSLDEKGIDISKLRLKQEFKGVRRDENL